MLMVFEALSPTMDREVCGHHVENELALEFPVCLLLSAQAGHEGAQGDRAERLAGRDGRTLEVPVVRREEVELELPRGLMSQPACGR